jgi:cysteinyl-tRNA synthetase
VWKGVDEKNQDEPYWESPFGNGRPGWHIECSALSRHYIGDTLDIHGGGADLIFPHHENEIAQSEAATGCPLSKIWMHNGMLNVDNKKMSKSLSNFFLVREAAGKYGYPPIRFMLLNAHYRSQLNYSSDVMESAINSLDRLQNCYDLIKRVSEAAIKGEVGGDVKKIACARKEQFIRAMDDDLNTADGISAIFELTRDINTLISNGVNKSEIDMLSELFNELCGVIGIEFKIGDCEIPKEVLDLVEKRKVARSEKNFALADKIREKIKMLGFSIEETRQGCVIKKT